MAELREDFDNSLQKLKDSPTDGGFSTLLAFHNLRWHAVHRLESRKLSENDKFFKELLLKGSSDYSEDSRSSLLQLLNVMIAARHKNGVDYAAMSKQLFVDLKKLRDECLDGNSDVSQLRDEFHRLRILVWIGLVSMGDIQEATQLAADEIPLEFSLDAVARLIAAGNILDNVVVI